MADESPGEVPQLLRRPIEIIEKYDYQIDFMSVMVLVLVAVPVLELLNLPEEWDNRTWVGRLGLVVYVPLALLTAVLGICAAVLIAAIHMPLFLIKVGTYEYRKRAYKEGREPDGVAQYDDA